MHLILVVKTPFSFFWKRSKQEAANSQVQRLMEPIEKKVGFTSSLDKDQWHELFIRLMGRANPYKLVTDYDVVPEALGQQASWQLPNDMAMIPLEDLPDAYADLFKENVTDPIQNIMYLFQDNNAPSRVWREGRAKKEGSFEVYPNDVPGRKPPKKQKQARGREGVPRGYDLDSWKRVGKDFYPPPASPDEGTVSKWYSHGAAGFKAAALDPRKAWELPRLYMKR